MIWFTPLFLALMATPSLTAAEEAESLFYSGTEAYSKGQNEEATRHFLDYLALRPNDARAHFNLSTLYSKKKKHGLAWSYFRKARALDPSLPGLSQLENRLQQNPPPNGGLSGPFHRWVRPFFSELNQTVLLFIALLAWTGFAHFLIRHLKTRKWAIESKEPRPHFPLTNWFLFGFAMLAAGFLLVQWLLTQQTYLSLISPEGLSLKSAPTTDSFEIGHLPEGVELKLLSRKENWIQVTNESGLSGWISSDAALIYPGASQ